MIKKMMAAITAALLCMTLMLTGCGSTTVLTMDMNENGESCTITFTKAGKETFASSGTLVVGDGDQVVIDRSLNDKGSVTLKFLSTDSLDGDASLQEIEDTLSSENCSLEAELSGTGQDTYELAPGDYQLMVNVNAKTTGTVNITVKKG